MTGQARISAAARLNVLFLSNRIPFPIKDGQTRRTYHILRSLADKPDRRPSILW